ncbi:ergothioneine biosynthesis glutamate--cysteine ligase EgtA [Actinokineospora sp. NBRC 105648]|uniref:ergothioneine biosynthesis glutamate--cysteine ligase EgtA n=1 Tax=Actinokineospora sp. NBRC 105648 TaxID=3032206 RepID=UPI0024A01ADE|nr:ergothioneine biosynthesis glutamate--cysteine ligase EgtA [Actinokineospora sp. NBRC 105648]GLZ36793.1 glutamate--cysteine ligase EgtA [Actinokineospora sp. NBRC 105648]
MSALCEPVEPDGRRLRARVEVEAYVASVCFKHGPPRLLGVELEWIVHHRDDPRRRLEPELLAAALGSHAPRTLRPDSPEQPLPAGSPLTVEPGGQVEISSLPAPAFDTVFTAVDTDHRYLSDLLARAGLELSRRGLDAHRTPRLVVDSPRYTAMERAFTPIGPHGITMMCASAGLQVCLDVGERGDVAARFAAVSSLGPVLVALFANSPDFAGSATGWAAARLRSVLAVDPARSRPVPVTDDPAAAWVRYVLEAPVICVRRPGANWDAPAGVTFADWVGGALPEPPTVDDLHYHMSTLFPPVRPHGYLEVRYLDAQDGTGWAVPAALLVALMADQRTVDAVVDACAPVADRWLAAARAGLADEPTALAARRVLDLGIPAVARLGLPPELDAVVAERLARLRDDTTTYGRLS